MHTSPDLLALLALGEHVGSAEEHAHLPECSECRAELQSLRAAVDAGRRTNDEDAVTSPPPHVWQRIRQELQLYGGQAATAPAPSGSTADTDTDAEWRARPGRPSRWGVRSAALVLAAALALAVGIGIGANLDSLLGGGNQVSGVQLNALPPWAGSSGRAVVEEDRDGNRTLVVEISSPQPATGPREVWLTNTVADPTKPMGFLDGNTGRFPIPEGIDLDQFPLVDVSQEPADDDDPGHSGRSMLRGRLPL